jgi:hypothetical protein
MPSFRFVSRSMYFRRTYSWTRSALTCGGESGGFDADRKLTETERLNERLCVSKRSRTLRHFSSPASDGSTSSGKRPPQGASLGLKCS